MIFRSMLVLAAVAAGALMSGAAMASDTPPPPPTDPVALAAYSALEKNCARCHQAGKLEKVSKPAKNFGNVLDLDKIATDPRLVVPGNPDGSKIVQQLLNKEMPYDVYYLADLSKDEPTPDDVTAIRTWVTSLATKTAASCETRKFIGNVDMVAAMAADIEKLRRTDVPGTRYVTLTHLYNACATDEEMDVYRKAVVKLLNSLSRNSDVLQLTTADPAKTIIRFNLRDLSWSPEDWDKILSIYPYGAKPETQFFQLIANATQTPLPYVRGDWLTFYASQPPLYDSLLRLPSSFPGLQQALGIDTKRNIERLNVKRAGFQHSGVSQNNRLIERHTIATGYFWTSYDFAGNRANQSLFGFPLGPGTGQFDFHEDGGETIFSLPNGFQAYYLNDAKGTKLDKGPTVIVRDTTRRDLAVTNGVSCMGCHELGIRKARDEIRPHVMGDRTFPKAVRDVVEAIYPPHDEMDKILDADFAKFTNAMERAGLAATDKDGKVIRDKDGRPTFPNLAGVEMLNALFKRYENEVDLRLAAAEFGLKKEDFILALASASDREAPRLKRRLEQGVIPRDTFEALFLRFVELVSDDEPLDPAKLVGHGASYGAPVVGLRPAVAERRNFTLTLYSDRSTYRINDRPVFTVTTERDCYLTLINVDAKGLATAIFPNQFQRDNRIRAGQDFAFPAANASFQFRFADPGTETVIAVCSLDNVPADNIALDFRAGGFTDLGNYENRVRSVVGTRQIKVESRPGAGGSAPATGGSATSGATTTTVRPTTEQGVVARAAIKMSVN